MTQDIGVQKILWGFLYHPNKERPVVFLMLKLLGQYALRVPPLVGRIRQGRGNCRKHLEMIEQHLSDGRAFMCGSQYTLADYD
eukprot:UN16374